MRLTDIKEEQCLTNEKRIKLGGGEPPKIYVFLSVSILYTFHLFCQHFFNSRKKFFRNPYHLP